ncbi:ImmA/IrrE family metallo-endopeptidase [Holdemania sp. 1001095H_141210_F2]|uniref:ImmA/IrrE family metallo-endopeptidase n=1 Tax=Holdemania sp. 1001095H_141210_F2 TaxID=2787149 RepID=UPI0018A00889|nr:ImmA/IrrE family metallo-endopeptidase [Holdemania sp. 1001095H_141210_F2]
MLVKEIIKNHKTNNPFVIALNLGITLSYEPLGNVRGYYAQIANQKQIHVNEDVIWYDRKFIVAHLLYHAIKNDDEKIVIWKKRNELEYSKNEKEGNNFAIELLLGTTELLEYDSFEKVCLSQGLTLQEYEGACDLLDEMADFNISKLSPKEIFEFLIR